MSNPVNFVNDYVAAVCTVVSSLQQLRTLNDMMAQDNTLVTRYFQDGNARKDIAAADMANAQAAMVQLLFTFDSGAPTQKSYLYKMRP